MQPTVRFAITFLFVALTISAQPIADYHQHLFHPADTGLAQDTGTVTAADLIKLLDAGIGRALVRLGFAN